MPCNTVYLQGFCSNISVAQWYIQPQSDINYGKGGLSKIVCKSAVNPRFLGVPVCFRQSTDPHFARAKHSTVFPWIDG